MLDFLPRRVHRFALRNAHRMRLWLWRATGRSVRGSNVIATDPQGRVLLVRHSYYASQTWMLPGGGLAAGESPVDAASRELAEETGCILSSPRHVGTVTLDRNGWTNRIELVSGMTTDKPRADGREIVEARFFDMLDMPPSTSAVTRTLIARWNDDQNGSSA